MPRLSRVLATTVATLSLGFVAAFPAYADPTPPPSPSGASDVGPGDPGVIQAPTTDPSGGKSYTWDLSSARWASAKRGAKALSPAHTNSSGQIDYRWVKKSFGSKKTQLYEFTSGFWYRRQDWGQFKNISAADKEAVIKWAKTHSGPNPTGRVEGGSASGSVITRTLAQSDSKGTGGTVQRAPKPCTGRTVVAYNKGDKLYWIYLNSCDTTNLVDAMDTGVQAIGVLGAVFALVTEGFAAIPAGVWGGELWVLKKYVENRQNASTIDAVIFRFSLNVGKSKYGRYYAPMRIFPQ